MTPPQVDIDPAQIDAIGVLAAHKAEGTESVRELQSTYNQNISYDYIKTEYTRLQSSSYHFSDPMNSKAFSHKSLFDNPLIRIFSYDNQFRF